MNNKFIVAAVGALIIGAGAMVLGGQWAGNSAVAADGDSFSKKEIETIIHDYLMDNPQVILEAVTKLQREEEAAAEREANEFLAANRDAIENAPGAYIAGNPNGDVTIVEFFDYHCGFCKRSLPGLMKMVEEDGNIKLVLREFPVLGPESTFAAKAALASIDLDGYMPLHMEMMQAKGKLNRSRIETMVEKTGMDLMSFNQLILANEAGYSKILEDNKALAYGLAINGTPSFVVGNRIIHGMQDADQLRAHVKQARSS